MYIQRAAEGPVSAVSQISPVLLAAGPRQAGKMTLLQKPAGSDRKYVTLDAPDARYPAKKDPALFLQRYTPPVLIDEIQCAPELLPHIKIRVGAVSLPGLSDAEICGCGSEPFTTDPRRLVGRLAVAEERSLNELYAGKEPPIFYYRNKEQTEMGLLLYQNGAGAHSGPRYSHTRANSPAICLQLPDDKKPRLEISSRGFAV